MASDQKVLSLHEYIEETRRLGRRNVIPVIHTRGSHYEIGFDIGRTFSQMIRSFVKLYRPLNETYLALYATDAGRKVYEETLRSAKAQFPQYVREIEGTADGAKVEFHKLFLMHLDDILPNAVNGTQANDLPVGCSTIICNQLEEAILGHNEDALSETMNHWYLVSAHVVESGRKEEKFTSLSYAGFLPGYTMGYNQHGLVYSINTLSAAVLRSGKTPRYFLARALLAAENFTEVHEILRNKGCGAAEGFSVNMTFLENETEKGDKLFYNIEVGPSETDSMESRLDILKVVPGETAAHCNRYLRMNIKETNGVIIDSSVHRMAAICKHPSPKTRQDVMEILSDQTDDEFPVFQEIRADDHVKTIATGIFDCNAKTWSVYTDKANQNEPVLVIPMQLHHCSSS